MRDRFVPYFCMSQRGKKRGLFVLMPSGALWKIYEAPTERWDEEMLELAKNAFEYGFHAKAMLSDQSLVKVSVDEEILGKR